MRNIVFSSLLVFTPLEISLAQDAQSSLAQEIEKSSETRRIEGGNKIGSREYFPEIRFRNYIDVRGCNLTAVAEETTAQGIRTLGITFDLARTDLPDPNDPNSSDWGVVSLAEHIQFGEIAFRFIEPYSPTPYGTGDLYGSMEFSPEKSYWFGMNELQDAEQPHRLLSLLHQYQAQYCALSG
ncbi:hypothetical protein GS610_00980 [Ruegeria sp. HKCCD6228]|uniref:Porin n=1 Tax=Ruegeria atlantica TaxID=81569 RepID=A0ABX1W5H7_9RHOB|nr:MULTISPECIES: hypothetical protein [Ruegeria]NOD29165.1 hypothetical protein [Ruegeria atlantica]NOD95775.1 hypothetical protein [Ruegeria sp. HKCCD6228]